MNWKRLFGRLVAVLRTYGGYIGAAAAVLTMCGLLLGRLSAFGIWDPWELSAADLARQLTTEAPALERPPLTTWLVARGFAVFGVHEWSGRLPMALSGLVAIGVAYLLVARFAGRRAGLWTAIVAATSPLFLFNARQMLGAAPGFAASAAVFLCASAAVFLPARLRASRERQRLFTIAWLVGLAISVVLATLANGVLLGVAPPLLGVGAAVLARNELAPSWIDRRRTFAALALMITTVVIAGGAAHAVWADYAGFGYWTGGVPRGGAPPTWEVAVERLFHSFAPWAALLPIALGRMLISPPRPSFQPIAPARQVDLHGPYRGAGPAPKRRRSFMSAAALPVSHPEEGALRLALVGWIAFGFLAQTLFTARYGPATFLPLVGAAAAVGLLLRDVERSERSWWGAALVAFLFVGLIIRDYAKYPSGPIAGLAAEGIEVPEVFNAGKQWAIALGGFGLLLALGFAADPNKESYPSLRALWRDLVARWRAGGGRRWTILYSWLRIGVPVELIVAQWKRGLATWLWMSFLALLVLAIVAIGALFLIIPDTLSAQLGTTSLERRVGVGLLLLLPGIFAAILIARLALFAFGSLRSYRLVPALVAALGVGAYASLVYLPELSSHFSPREVYDTYNALAEEGEPLGEFRVGGRAAAYYATGEIEELDSQAQLIEFLAQDRRVWAAFRADDLAAVNRDYRRRANRHLFIADARSARMLLATNQPVEGRPNRNYLADAILDEPPRPQHPSNINFDDRVELLGIDLDLPHGSYVGPGEAFQITWYFRVIAPVPGGYQPFVHIDGPGQRINGDHEPVDGRYPVRLWEPGDIVVDRQELRIPANYRRGNLTIYMGFYSGEQRLEIIRGPEDDVNRGRAGTLQVR